MGDPIAVWARYLDGWALGKTVEFTKDGTHQKIVVGEVRHWSDAAGPHVTVRAVSGVAFTLRDDQTVKVHP